MNNIHINQCDNSVNFLTKKEKLKLWRQTNKEKVNEANRRSYANNKEKIRLRQKEYYQNNKEKIIQKHLEYERLRKTKDEMFKAQCIIRGNVNNAFKRIKFNKPTNTTNLLGCTWVEAKEHFEKLFVDGMSWDNHGEWHIDHIRPVSSFALNEIHLANRITNLQPLWAMENILKSNMEI